MSKTSSGKRFMLAGIFVAVLTAMLYAYVTLQDIPVVYTMGSDDGFPTAIYASLAFSMISLAVGMLVGISIRALLSRAPPTARIIFAPVPVILVATEVMSLFFQHEVHAVGVTVTLVGMYAYIFTVLQMQE